MASEAKGRYLWDYDGCRWFVRADTLAELKSHYNTFGRNFDNDYTVTAFDRLEWFGVQGDEGKAQGQCWQDAYLAEAPTLLKSKNTFIVLGIIAVCICLYLLYKNK